MKNIVLMMVLVVFVVWGVIWYLKPNQPVNAFQQANSLEKTSQQKELNHSAITNSENRALQNSAASDSAMQKHNSELADTKSDPSIQPIDPEKDPGNQLLDSK